MIIPITSIYQSQLEASNGKPIEWAMIELNGEILPPLDGFPSSISSRDDNDNSHIIRPSTVELGLIRFENVSKNAADCKAFWLWLCKLLFESACYRKPYFSSIILFVTCRFIWVFPFFKYV